MKRLFATLAVFLAFVSFAALPYIAFGQNTPSNATLIVCGDKEVNGVVQNQCGWADLVQLAIHIINFCMYLVVPLAALSFAYAGFLILSAGGDSGKVKKGKDIFTKVAIGIFWVIAGWLVIHTILIALLGPSTTASSYILIK